MADLNIWEVLTSVGTVGAVLVALFLPAWQGRRRVTEQVIAHGGYSGEKNVEVLLVNTGGKSVTLLRLLTLGRDGTLKERSEAGKTPTFPKTLHPTETVSLSYPYVSEHLAEIREIFVEDSLGRRWRCNPKSRRTALAILGEQQEVFSQGEEFRAVWPAFLAGQCFLEVPRDKIGAWQS